MCHKGCDGTHYFCTPQYVGKINLNIKFTLILFCTPSAHQRKITKNHPILIPPYIEKTPKKEGVFLYMLVGARGFEPPTSCTPCVAGSNACLKCLIHIYSGYVSGCCTDIGIALFIMSKYSKESNAVALRLHP